MEDHTPGTQWLGLIEPGRGKNMWMLCFWILPAFDKVDHGILLHKIKSLGITGKPGLWLHNFLTGQTQSVMVNG